MAVITRRQIASSIAEQLDTANNPQHLAQQIAAFLVKERRTNELEALMRDVRRLREKDGTVELTVTSAFPLTAQLSQRIKSLFPAKNIIFKEKIDKSVLGGVRIETMNKQLDLTVANELDSLKQLVKSQGAHQ